MTDRSEPSDSLSTLGLKEIKYKLETNLYKMRRYGRDIERIRQDQRKLITELEQRGIRDEFELEQILDRE